MTDMQRPDAGSPVDAAADGFTDEEFRPTGTLFILALFVATLILLWLSVYIILLSRGVTT